MYSCIYLKNLSWQEEGQGLEAAQVAAAQQSCQEPHLPYRPTSPDVEEREGGGDGNEFTGNHIEFTKLLRCQPPHKNSTRVPCTKNHVQMYVHRTNVQQLAVKLCVPGS